MKLDINTSININKDNNSLIYGCVYDFKLVNVSKSFRGIYYNTYNTIISIIILLIDENSKEIIGNTLIKFDKSNIESFDKIDDCKKFLSYFKNNNYIDYNELLRRNNI